MATWSGQWFTKAIQYPTPVVRIKEVGSDNPHSRPRLRCDDLGVGVPVDFLWGVGSGAVIAHDLRYFL